MNIEISCCDPGKYPLPENGHLRCSKCGHLIKSFSEWVGDGERILCEFCYRNVMFSSLDASPMEVMD
jgi:formylmethanofuran dehydrogenase subunit E